MSIKVKCEACGRTIKAPEKYAGRQAKCPGCDAKITIPALADVSPSVETVTPPQPPPAPAVKEPMKLCPLCAEPIMAAAVKCKHCGAMLDGSDKVEQPKHSPPDNKEKTLKKVRPSMSRNRPISSTILGLGMAVGFGTYLGSGGGEVATPGLIIGCCCFVIMLLWWLSCVSTTLTITSKRSILRRGILAKNTREVRHADVRLLEVSQSFLQRLLGVGKIEVASAGHSNIEITLAGIAAPHKIKELIDSQRP